TITKPVVTLTTNGKLITQSAPENKTIVIEPMGVSQIDTIEFEVGWPMIGSFVSGIIPRVPKILTAFLTGSTSAIGAALGIPLEMRFTTYVDGIYYQSDPEKIL